MTVEEIKALAPQAEVYELNPATRYIIVLARHASPKLTARELGLAVMRMTGNAPTILRTTCPAEDIRLLEVKP